MGFLPASNQRQLATIGYWRTGGVSLVQSILKHSLVPVRHLEPHLPRRGLILDLGCGEGMFANLVGRLVPECRIVGIDRDVTRIRIARRNAVSNAVFLPGDVFQLPTGDGIADAVILNDVAHHTPYARHQDLMEAVIRRLRPGGLIILKEVDQADVADRTWTRFFDSRLYPHDPLCFRTAGEWLSLLKRVDATEVTVARMHHPWPASRTLFLAAAPTLPRPHRGGDAALIGRDNLNRGTDTVVVLVTGATGFIGGHVARRLLRCGLGGKKVRLLALTRDPGGLAADLVAQGAVPVAGELADLPRLRQALQGVEFVFHLAAEVKFSGGTDIWRHNYEGTAALLEALQGVPLRRFVHASTIGAVDRHPSDPCTEPLDEQVPPHPLSDYGRSKLRAETAVQQSGLPYTIVRVTWCYGPGMTPDTHIRNLMQAVYERKLFSFFDFPGRVSVIAAEDMARVFVLLSENEQAANNTYFTTDGQPIALGALFRLMGEMVGRRAGFIPIPQPLPALARRLRRWLPLPLQNLHSDVLCATNERLVRLGFAPATGKREGLRLLATSIGLYPGPADGRRLVTAVTGAASGIGHALAAQLHRRGHHLLLIDRDETRLRQTAAELGADFLCLDLTLAASLDELDRYLETGSYRLDWVVNCAGVGVRGQAVEIPFSRQRAVIDLNCTACTSISLLALKHFTQSGRGQLINIASSAGFQALPYMAVYAASKAYVLSFTRGLSGELSAMPGISVLTVNPAGTATQFQSNAGVRRNAGEKLLSPDYVAHQILRAADRGQTEITIGLTAKGMALMSRVLPTALQVRLWRHLMEQRR